MIYSQRIVPPEFAMKCDHGPLFNTLGEIKISDKVVSVSLHPKEGGAPRYSDNDLKLLIAKLAVAKEMLPGEIDKNIRMLRMILGENPDQDEHFEGFHPDTDHCHVRQMAKIMLAQAGIKDCDCDCPCSCLAILEVSMTVNGTQIRTRKANYVLSTVPGYVCEQEKKPA